MSFLRLLLKPIAHVAGMHASSQLAAFVRAHNRTEQTQAALLRDLLKAGEGSAFCRDYGFDKIRGYDDFAARVPVGSYETLEPYIKRVLNGESSALLGQGESPIMFAMTSGTTGAPKYIPVSRQFLASIKRGWNIWGMAALKRHPRAFLRPMLQISSPMQETSSPNGVPCGAISGLLAARQKRIVRRMYVSIRHLGDIADAEEKYYCLLRAGIARDVSIIVTANPSSTIKLIEVGRRHVEALIKDIADGTCTPPGQASPLAARWRPNKRLAANIDSNVRRDGDLYPHHFWKVEFLGNWTGGTLKLYLPRLRELFPSSAICDIGLLASEGRFSAPLEDDSPAGVAEITSNLLEFLPEGESVPVPAHKVEIGGEYTLIVSNWAGLWRYNMDDRVRVTGRFGQSPVFEFLSRGRNTANITGEKITEQQVVEAMRRACCKTGLRVERFVMQGCFAAKPYYEVRVENLDASEAQKLVAEMDLTLCELNIEYRSKRLSSRLGPLQAKIMPPGVLESVENENIRLRRNRSEQYKHQYLLTDVQTPDAAGDQ